MFGGRQLNFGDYLLIAKRQKWLLLLPFLFISTGVGLWSLSLPDIYSASTLILVEAQAVPESYVRATVSATVQQRLHTITQQTKSRTWLERVIRELHLLDGINNPDFVGAYIDKMRRNIDVRVQGDARGGSGSTTFTVSYSDREPRTVMLVANKIASLFIEENVKVRVQQAEGTTQFLDTELQRIRQTLQEQEQVIINFRQQYMGELPEQQETNLRSLDRLQLQLQGNMEAIESARNRQSLVRRQLSLLPSEDSVVRGEAPLEVQLKERRAALEALRRQFTDSYPDVARLQQEVAALEVSVKAQALNPSSSVGTLLQESPQIPRVRPDSPQWRFQQEIDQIDLHIAELERQRASIVEQIAAYEKKVTNAASREQDLKVLTRDYESMRKNYEALLAKKMEAKVAENLENRQKAEQFKVLDPARVPLKPSEPDRSRILAIGLALGVAVGCGLVFLVEFFDHSFRDWEDLQQYTSLPVLATIPLIVTPTEQKKQQWKQRLSYVAIFLLPVVALTAVHLFWMKIDIVFARTLQLLNP